MEMRGTNFAKRNNHDVLVITLGSEEESFELKLMVPTKGVYEDICHMAGLIDDVMEGKEGSTECIDEIFGFVCRAMSHNTDGRVVTMEDLEASEFSLADAGLFLGDYIQFLSILAARKN